MDDNEVYELLHNDFIMFIYHELNFNRNARDTIPKVSPEFVREFALVDHRYMLICDGKSFPNIFAHSIRAVILSELKIGSLHDGDDTTEIKT